MLFVPTYYNIIFMEKTKVVVLDRDGVINEYPGDREYVKSWQEFKFLPRAKEAIKMLNDAGFKVCIASNQAGVSKGIYSQKALDDLTARMQQELNLTGARIEEVYYCIHKEEENCGCRKPKIGMLEKAVKDKRAFSYFIGDTQRDIQTGCDFGAKTILVLSGKIKHEDETKDWPKRPDFIAEDLFEAAQAIINNKV